MSVREYIGARYVPLFADPLDWDSTKTYEPLTIVLYQGNSYTSKQSVPAGIEISNETYWAETGNYNAQIEQYRAEVADYAESVDDIEDAIPMTDFDSTNTVKAAIETVESDLTDAIEGVESDLSDAIDAISDVLPASSFDSTNTVKKAIDDINDILPSTDFDSTNTVKAAIEAVEDDVTDINSEIASIKAEDKIIFAPLSLYVSMNGSDDNDGTSTQTPLKTLDKAFSFYKKGYTNILINIIESGIYHTTANNLINATNHIYSTVSGVTVIFDQQLRSYNTYMDFASASLIDIQFPNGFHNDAVDLYLYNAKVTVDSRCDFTGGSVTIDDNCSVTTSIRIALANCQVYLQEGATFNIGTNSDALSNLVRAYNSMITCSASLVVTVPITFTNPYFRIERCFLVYSGASITLGNLTNISYALVLRASVNIVHATVYATISGKINTNYSIIQAKSATTIFD